MYMKSNSRRTTLFWLRNFLIFSQVFVWVLAKYLWNIDYPYSVLLLTVGYFVFNLITWFTIKKPSDTQLFIHLIIDVIELSVFFYLTGGASNPFTWFLLIAIIFSATVLPQKYTWILTGLSISCYSLLIKYFQPVTMEMTGHEHHTTSFSQHLVGMWLGFIVISIIVSWVIIGLLKNIRSKDTLLMQANLKQADNDKMLALATLATGSAHELGTPLATINIVIKELLNNPELTPYHRSLAIVESQVYRCKDSLTEITASTGTTQAIKGSVVSVNVFLKGIKQQLNQPQAINLDFDVVDNNSDKLLTDKTLSQAVVNIITNAFESGATDVDVCTKIEAGDLILTIHDNGKGMLAKFEGDKSVSQSEKEFGMGLGLFLAKATIERFSGSIQTLQNNTVGVHIQINLPVFKS